MTKHQIHFLEEGELREGIKVCCQKVNGLLNCVLVLVSNHESVSHALDLYSLAIEEHGKALFLRDYLSKEKVAGKYAVSKSPIFKGKDAHERKFERAGEDLPHDCINILRSVAVNSNPSTKQTTILYPTVLHESGLFDETSLAQVTVSGSGTMTDVTGFGSVVPVSVAERFRSFYVDWDDQNKQWKGDWYTQDQLVYQFVPDIDALRDAILVFKQRIKSILDTL